MICGSVEVQYIRLKCGFEYIAISTGSVEQKKRRNMEELAYMFKVDGSPLLVDLCTVHEKWEIIKNNEKLSYVEVHDA